MHLVRNFDEAGNKVRTICGDAGASCVALAEMPAEVLTPIRLGLGNDGVDVLGPHYEHESLPDAIDRAEVGVTAAEFAIAETGTMVEVAENDANRLVSSLPRIHVCLVRTDTLVETLSDAAPLLRDVFALHNKNCVVSFISGPSRTGDIEMKLTLGVHGPEFAHAVIVSEGMATDESDA